MAYSKICPVLSENVINYFLTHSDNKSKIIAEKFKTTEFRVNYILEKYLKEKMKLLN